MRIGIEPLWMNQLFMKRIEQYLRLWVWLGFPRCLNALNRGVMARIFRTLDQVVTAQTVSWGSITGVCPVAWEILTTWESGGSDRSFQSSGNRGIPSTARPPDGRRKVCIRRKPDRLRCRPGGRRRTIVWTVDRPLSSLLLHFGPTGSIHDDLRDRGGHNGVGDGRFRSKSPEIQKHFKICSRVRTF